MKLTRVEANDNGIFGVLLDDTGKQLAVTLEHSYFREVKLPVGEYICVRGQHRLHNMINDFTTFQITEVPGHSNILFHWGNYNKDSDGCVLLGESRVGDMIINSRITFVNFMQSLNGIDKFNLEVV